MNYQTFVIVWGTLAMVSCAAMALALYACAELRRLVRELRTAATKASEIGIEITVDSTQAKAEVASLAAAVRELQQDIDRVTESPIAIGARA